MMLLVVAAFSLLVFLCLSLFLFFFLRCDGVAQDNRVDQTHPVAGLSAITLPHFEVIVGAEDYRKLRRRPELQSVREIFWRERRRIALMWLGELQKDVHILWKFRRFLVRNALPVTFQQETTVVGTALLALLFLRVARLVVFIFGPFALHEAVAKAGVLVELLSRFVVTPLGRVSALRRAEVERQWALHLVATGIKAG